MATAKFTVKFSVSLSINNNIGNRKEKSVRARASLAILEGGEVASRETEQSSAHSSKQ